LLVAALVTIVGIVVSATGAPDPGVFGDWGRVDDIARRVASWEYVLVAVVAVVILLRGGAGATKVVLAVALGYLAVLAIAAVLGVLAVFERQTLQPDGTRPPLDYYTSQERIGEIIVFAGLLAAIVVTAGVAVTALRRRGDAGVQPTPAPGQEAAGS
jgi:hypothetical protein